MHSITRQELKKQIDAGANIAIVDALPGEYFKKGHLPNALSIPADQVSQLAPEKLRDKNQMIVTYCANASCPKSKEAAAELREMGYLNVVEYADGLEDWKGAGLPLETSAEGERAYGSGARDKTSQTLH